MAKKIVSYEKAMLELEQIVNDLQNGNINIDQLADKIKRAAQLTEYCKNKLRNTEAIIDESLKK